LDTLFLFSDRQLDQCAENDDKDAEMINTLQRALLLTMAGLLVFNPAVADEPAPRETPKTETVDTDLSNRELASKANKAAADQAARSVIEATRLDLDIRLIGPTSVRIAGDR
jgi:hypothetical protein